MTEPTDAELLAAARRGDAEALDSLLARYQARIYRFGMKMCRDPADAEDVLQETLLAMARGVREFRGASSLSTWLYSVARSYCVKKRRKSGFAPDQQESIERGGRDEACQVADPGAGPEDVLLGREIEVALARAIASLDHEHREVFLLRDVEGLKAAEVAEVVGSSVSAVKSRLHRARQRVRETIVVLLDEREARNESDTCPDIVETYSRYLESDIGPEVCKEMEQHVEACATCRHTCDSLKRTLSLCQSLPDLEVPAEVQRAIRASLRKLVRPESAAEPS